MHICMYIYTHLCMYVCTYPGTCTWAVIFQSSTRARARRLSFWKVKSPSGSVLQHKWHAQRGGEFSEMSLNFLGACQSGTYVSIEPQSQMHDISRKRNSLGWVPPERDIYDSSDYKFVSIWRQVGLLFCWGGFPPFFSFPVEISHIT